LKHDDFCLNDEVKNPDEVSHDAKKARPENALDIKTCRFRDAFAWIMMWGSWHDWEVNLQFLKNVRLNSRTWLTLKKLRLKRKSKRTSLYL
jgi:hypothetical protein